jgi:hypothetical protein
MFSLLDFGIGLAKLVQPETGLLGEGNAAWGFAT